MPLDWDNVHLVVFDVDGTLYRQRPLQLRMARDILLYTLLKRDLNVIAVLARYRRIRERLGDEQAVDFERALIAQTATATANSQDSVRAIVSEWVEQRPLGYLAACRYPNLPQLFSGLRRSGKSIGILSDYPAVAKLEALGLTANYVAFAGDAGIGVLKPHPRGLEFSDRRRGREAARNRGHWRPRRSRRARRATGRSPGFDQVFKADRGMADLRQV